jgi:hypothetical protein
MARLTLVGSVPVEFQNAAVMHGYDQLVRADNCQPVRMLEPKAWRRVRLARVAEPAIDRRPLPEVVWS